MVVLLNSILFEVVLVIFAFIVRTMVVVSAFVSFSAVEICSVVSLLAEKELVSVLFQSMANCDCSLFQSVSSSIADDDVDGLPMDREERPSPSPSRSDASSFTSSSAQKKTAAFKPMQWASVRNHSTAKAGQRFLSSW